MFNTKKHTTTAHNKYKVKKVKKCYQKAEIIKIQKIQLCQVILRSASCNLTMLTFKWKVHLENYIYMTKNNQSKQKSENWGSKY